jgi:broad specificity phosphatase PhoE
MDEVLFGRVVDSPLDEHGQRQAETLAERLTRRLRLEFIAVSPRLRTQQTGAKIAERTGCASETNAAFDEVDFGRWSSLKFAELQSDPAWREWNADRNTARTPAGDTITAVQDRAMNEMQALRVRFPLGPIAIVSHSEVIRSIVLRCLNLPASHYHRLRIDPASVSCLEMHDDFIRLESLNERLT